MKKAVRNSKQVAKQFTNATQKLFSKVCSKEGEENPKTLMIKCASDLIPALNSIKSCYYINLITPHRVFLAVKMLFFS